MGKLGKVFGVLVLLLSIAVAVLSWMLAEQRTLFRGHSEALADGLMMVKNKVGGYDGLDVSGDLNAVSYQKAPKGGKESGTLGFEDYRKNKQSVSSSVNALIAALDKRQEQVEALSGALADVNRRIHGLSSISNKSLLVSAEYQKQLKQIRDRAGLVVNRDEAVRRKLVALSGRLGVSGSSLQPGAFSKSERRGNDFVVTGVFGEIDNTLRLLEEQQKLYTATMGEFKDAIATFGDWTFDGKAVDVTAKGYVNSDKSSSPSGQQARAAHLRNVKSKLNAFVSDAKALNRYIGKLKSNLERVTGEAEDLKTTARAAEDRVKELGAQLAEVQEVNRKLAKDNAWAKKNIKDLAKAKSLNAVPADPREGKILKELKEIDPRLVCNVSLVQPEYNFVIVSANNRQLCAGARLVVIRRVEGKEAEPSARLEVLKCTDLLSIANVIKGDVKSVAIGDRVELSYEHDGMVQQVAEEKKAAAEAAEREKRLEADRRAREIIERRREAEKKNNEELLMGF